MQNLNNKKFNCTGCGGCANVCPTKAIKIKEDKEGFYQYFIDEKRCINCGKCIKICPKLSKNEISNISVPSSYAAYTKNETILNNSSSGGLFYEIAKYFIESGGLVAGVIYENNSTKHILTDSIEDLKEIQGSKYLQSFTGNIYSEIKNKVKSNKVLFVGTPCQCAAIKNIIKSNNLITIDIVCHGVPSKKIFEKSLEDRFNKKIVKVNFRFKDKSWSNYSLQYSSNHKVEKTIKNYKDEWFCGYLKNLYLMKSCYSCEFNKLPRVGDITLADCWGIQNIDEDFFKKNEDKGISLIILNNDIAKDIFEKIKKNIIYKKQDLNKFKDYNPRLFSGNYLKKMLNDREKFFNEYLKYSFKKKRYSITMYEELLRKIKSVIKKIIRK